MGEMEIDIWLDNLVRRWVDDGDVENALETARRLLGSGMCPPPSVRLEAHEVLIDGLVRRRVVRPGGGAEEAGLLGEMATELAAGGCRRPGALLYLLSALEGVAEGLGRQRKSTMTGANAIPVERERPGEMAKTGTGTSPLMQSRATHSTDGMIPRLGSIFDCRVEEEPGMDSENQVPSRPKPERESLEILLVRDLLFTAQGIDGTLIKIRPGKEGPLIHVTVQLSLPVEKLVREIGQLGLLFVAIQSNLKLMTADRLGAVVQSFAAAVEVELDDYYRQLSQLRLRLEENPSAMTLRRLYVWALNPRENLSFLEQTCEHVRDKRGGSLASAVFARTKHGDPGLAALSLRLFRRVCAPIGESLYKWIREGELDDPAEEFFITENPDTPSGRQWTDGHLLREGMLPSFISREIANKALMTGRIIAFLRLECDNLEWITSRRESQTRTAGRCIRFEPSMVPPQEDVNVIVEREARIAFRRLKDQLLHKYNFLGHCANIKRYILLGQGDFVHGLMISLTPELNKPASLILRSTLINILETEFRNAAGGDDTGEESALEHLDIRLFESTPEEIGWDIFSLDYRLANSPLSVVFSKPVMKNYLRLFGFLWRLRRVDHILRSNWLSQRPVLLLAQCREKRGVSHETFQIKKFSILRSKMMDLIRNVQYYVMIEALETPWRTLQVRADEAEDLNGLIAAHDTYLADMCDNALLSASHRQILDALCQVLGLIVELTELIGRQQFPSLGQGSLPLERMIAIDGKLNSWLHQFYSLLSESCSSNPDSKLVYLLQRLDVK
uniref:Spindle pole body component n=1 Tax=Compsopogon caeruleus TaxID=31354 RepID=A0A7S1THC2_9RHOD|mmetsp:Transcript_6591/g.13318  ORF Transcript_6591/g.13318 Transcript_6591/m.13318 type:complete len:788 (+) Transcript_6591:1221-3584(+)